MTNRIRQLRKEHQMTQADLSAELEVTQETISAYENERHYPSFPQLVKLSSLFNVSIDYIMGLSNVRSPGTTVEDSDCLRLTCLGRRLNKEQFQFVFAYIQGMLDITA